MRPAADRFSQPSRPAFMMSRDGRDPILGCPGCLRSTGRPQCKVRKATRTTLAFLRSHEILRGFENTSVLPGAEFRVPVKAVGAEPVLAVLPPYPAFPPEMVYSRAESPAEPA